MCFNKFCFQGCGIKVFPGAHIWLLNFMLCIKALESFLIVLEMGTHNLSQQILPDSFSAKQRQPIWRYSLPKDSYIKQKQRGKKLCGMIELKTLKLQGFQKLPTHLGSWSSSSQQLRCSNLCFCHHSSFSASDTPGCPLIKTPVITLGLLDDLRYPPHLMILNHICQVPFSI